MIWGSSAKEPNVVGLLLHSLTFRREGKKKKKKTLPSIVVLRNFISEHRAKCQRIINFL
jgi:hypothetical protein